MTESELSDLARRLATVKRHLTDDEAYVVERLSDLRPHIGLPARKAYGQLAVGLLAQRSQREIASLLDVPREWLR